MAGVRPMRAAISSWEKSKTSCNNSTARAAGVKRSSATRNAIDTCSTLSRRAIPAWLRSTGSGSRSPRLSSRRARADVSSFKQSLVTIVTRNARGDVTGSS